ncbi:hypothetical protein H072_174 [Dactylellina haptotyla CBS 200.50]|uniref:ribonuclease H n=1 Tax=Dactylellina haptotyla (strain CBS 200.50) TaxID=1284197 RepID=S8C249_DACHA|nr:hypothetical protein H072_174 [Dactylellina haptotyla CBS 200.50]
MSTQHVLVLENTPDSFPGMILAPFARNPEQEAAEDDVSFIPEIAAFAPPDINSTPQELFPAGVNYDCFNVPHDRFIHIQHRRIILIYTDGACLMNGDVSATAGCAFYFRPPGPTAFGSTTGIISFRLEDKGPDAKPAPQTSNRAELRAVIAALEFRVWYGEGQKHLVIATDSEYVVLGITQWVKTWAQNGWRNSKGKPVANRDLWEFLLKELRNCKRNDFLVSFWRIPRELNTVADGAAKLAALEPAVERYTKQMGMMV